MTLRLLSAANAAQLDKELMSTGAFSLDQLMELAGLAVAQCVYRVTPPSASSRILVVCGPGNNGGDGLVAARHLYFFGYQPVMHYPKRSDKEIYKRLTRQLESLEIPFTDDFAIALKQTDHVLDAIFGFSFSGDVRAPFDTVIKELEKASVPVTAIDAPSSWNIERGPPEAGKTGHSYVPNTLISLTAPKPLVKWYQGRHFVGGRFLTPSLAGKYNLDQPPFEKDEQVVEVSARGQGERL